MPHSSLAHSRPLDSDIYLWTQTRSTSRSVTPLLNSIYPLIQQFLTHQPSPNTHPNPLPSTFTSTNTQPQFLTPPHPIITQYSSASYLAPLNLLLLPRKHYAPKNFRWKYYEVTPFIKHYFRLLDQFNITFNTD